MTSLTSDSSATSSATYSDVEDQKGDIQTEPSFVPMVAPLWMLTLMSIGVLVTGTCTTLFNKLQNRQFVPTDENCAKEMALLSPERREPAPSWWDEDAMGEWTCYRYFTAPLFQTLLMYIGEWWCQWIWLIEMQVSKCQGRPRPRLDLMTTAASFKKPHCPIYIWILPTLLDYVATALINVAFIISYASTIQIMRNFSVVITACLMMFYVKLALRMRNWIGVVLLTVGMILTAMMGIINPEETTNVDPGLAFLGIIIALISTTLHAFQGVFEERMMRKYFASPFEGVGWMGFFGCIFSTIILIIAQFADMEDTKVTFYQIGYDSLILTGVLVYLFCVCFYNGFGLSVAKLGSALHRTVLSSTRGAIIWVIEVSIGWNTFDQLSLWGMILVTMGGLLYNVDLFCWCPKLSTWMKTPWICFSFTRDPDEVGKESPEETKKRRAREAEETQEETQSASSNDEATEDEE